MLKAQEHGVACPPHLPPRDAWKIDPEHVKKFYAPTDDRGFVLPDQTVEKVLDLFEDEYEWPIDLRHQAKRPNVHHFHWIARQYEPARYKGRTVPNQFRELPSVKGIVPRQFHNVIHNVTLPPQMPKYRDMERHIRAYRLARWTFDSATRAMEVQSRFIESDIIADSNDTIANEILITAFDRQFRGYRMNIERLIGASGLEILRLDDPKFSRRKPHEIHKKLGSVIRTREMDFTSLFKTAA